MKRLPILILWLLLGCSTFAQTKDEAVTNLRHQVLDYPQEKLFLQMDRPQYDAGDTIWFRAHTVSEAFHLPSAMSRGIFVNLYGPAEKLSHTLKVLLLLRGVPELIFQLTPEHDFLYIGKAELASGVHEIVLVDENNRVLSQRQIFIRNDDQVHVTYNIFQDSLNANRKKKTIQLDLQLTDAEGQPIMAEFSASLYPDTFGTEVLDSRNITSEFLLHTDLSQHLFISGSYFEKPTTNLGLVLDAWLIASRWPKFDIQRAIDGDFESSWDIGEKPEASFLRDSTGIYRPLSAEEKALRAKYRQIDLNAVNIYPEQLNKNIKPYTYVNHSVKGEELVIGGSTIQDYLVNLPGVAWDYAKGFMTIRNGTVSYMLDGFNTNWDAIAMLTTAEIESVDVLKDPGNMGVFKFMPDSGQISNDEQMAIGGVVAVWTKRAIDVKPQMNKRRLQKDAPVISDDVRRLLMSGTKDIWLSQFPNMSRANLWKPSLVGDDAGNVQIRFTPNPGIKRYVLEMNGVGAKGQLLYDRKIIEVPIPQ